MEQSKSNNETLEGVDTEQGLDGPTETELKEKFQEAVDKAAEERAASPYQVSAQSHAMMYHPFVAKLENISGGAAKRILKYLVGYPFYVNDLNPQDKEVESMGATADRLVQAKFTMIMCEMIEKEKAKMEEFKKLEDSIEPVPADLPKAELKLTQPETNNEENKE